MKLNNIEIEKNLVVSTGHITKKDNELLTKEFIIIITDKKKKRFSLTKKGYTFLEKYSIVVDFIEKLISSLIVLIDI